MCAARQTINDRICDSLACSQAGPLAIQGAGMEGAGTAKPAAWREDFAANFRPFNQSLKKQEVSMNTWAEVRAFAEKCIKMVYVIQKYPSDKEIVLHSLLEVGHLGFLAEPVDEPVRPLSQATFDEINAAMVELNRCEAMPNDIAHIKKGTDAYKYLAKIVKVLKEQLHVKPDGVANRRIWDAVLAVK